MTVAWEAGHAVIAALACWVVAVGILAGMVAAAVVRGVVGAWRWLCASVAAVRAWQAFRSAGPAERPSGARLWLRAAPVPPTRPPAQSHSETSSKETA